MERARIEGGRAAEDTRRGAWWRWLTTRRGSTSSGFQGCG